ncbi:hypothetical protein SUDANB130_03771 [Streptomyces sp. enrichment culture]
MTLKVFDQCFSHASGPVMTFFADLTFTPITVTSGVS